MDRTYIVLARDAQTKDTIVFGVRAENAVQARGRVEKFYHQQDWEGPEDIQVASFRANAPDPVLYVGHAHYEYQKLEGQIKQLCEKLLQAADWLEGDMGATDSRDELYKFVEGFDAGKQLIDAKYEAPA